MINATQTSREALAEIRGKVTALEAEIKRITEIVKSNEARLARISGLQASTGQR